MNSNTQTVGTTPPNPYRLINIGCGPDERKAISGKFRAVITIDSDEYKVGDDWTTREKARDSFMVVGRAGCTVQIYNDQGVPQLDEENKLIN